MSGEFENPKTSTHWSVDEVLQYTSWLMVILLTVSTVVDHDHDYVLVDSERAAIVITQ
jgi:hypothetical protein